MLLVSSGLSVALAIVGIGTTLLDMRDLVHVGVVLDA